MPISEQLEPRKLLAAAVLDEEVSDFGASEFADDVAVQKDRRIVVLGHTEGAAGGDRLFLARYDVDGSLDPFFGENGRIFGAFSEFTRATSLTIDRSGRMIVAGVTNASDPEVAAMRFTRSGFLDQSFGSNGLAKLNVSPGGSESAADVAVDSSGRVFVAGQAATGPSSSPNSRPAMMVARFDVFGRADLSFGNEDADDFGLADGVSVVPIGDESGASGVLLDGSRVYVAGFGTEEEIGQGPEKRFTLVRLEQNGALDRDFGDGEDGIVVVDFGLPSVAQELDLADDGKIVVIGNTLPTLDTPGEQIILARFDRGGSLDGSFGGGDGFVLTGFGGARSQLARGVVVDNQDRVLFAGEINDAGDPSGDLNDDRFLVGRYLEDGTPDTAFAPGGALVEEVRTGDNNLEQVANIALQKDGKNGSVVVAGNTGTTTADQDLALVRVATDATLSSGSARIKGKTLLVRGTDRSDVITVSPNFAAGTIEVNVNGSLQSFPGGNIARIGIVAKDGDDEVTCSVGGEVITTIQGNDDDDDLRLLGDARGRIEGGDDDDDIVGGDRDDRLRGGRGDDRIFAGDGHDDLNGDSGFDDLFGEDGDDQIKAADGFHDDIDGGGGDDEAEIDFFDEVSRIDDIDVD